MTKRNLKTIFIGLCFICLAIMSGLAAFYYLEVKPELEQREMAKAKRLVAQETKIQKRAEVIRMQEKEQTPEAPIKMEKSASVESFVREAETLYSEEEMNKKEGYLWVDRKSSKYVVTLGAINGLNTDSQLAVYQGKDKIGSVIVDLPLDVISYVRPANPSQKFSENNYYRVVIE